MDLHAVSFGDRGADISYAGGACTVQVELAAVDFSRDADKVSRCPTTDRERRDHASSEGIEPIGDRTLQILGVMFDATNNQDVLETPCDIELAMTYEAEVPCSKERALAVH